ncbi:hypothetical protein TCAL_11219 [Tigriopus californicus]|uniref:Aminopeptidase n=1 Tax=Tigriopus californicus TaxID=6832 RepID=A0A553PJX3_TIGCA|nr:puromycin-sensitive aminopeptidase-like [Tigriopus californicus]TRY77959.1 hypothetical protein TCAL_11219 [Tigriopus californicus]|eukprot:TCALIF_11219-PA protein Name:"Similar to Npepps Puromycin-sensitive aminopeptidase (Mus musculus)" AED:0.00 eAED:0.00 QI:520/1/1/1/1/1/2/212/880
MTGSAVASMAFARLPAHLRPLHYNVRLKPDLVALTFQGWMNVEVEVLRETSEIVCNAAELTVQRLTAESTAQPDWPAQSFGPEGVQLDEFAETLRVQLARPLPVGLARIHCVYQGVLNDRMRGFYRSRYTTPDGQTRFAAATQFESTEARRCFPCWDEPALKSSFSLSVIAPRDRTVHSNMPEAPDLTDPVLDTAAADQVGPNDRLVLFGPSPIMSTYLLALVVGEFESVDGHTQDDILVRSFTPIGKVEQGRFAMETSVRALEFYTQFFDVPYPLPKYDCIALADFECGAMENWGLVTYRESCILVDAQNTSTASKQFIAIVVCHEMAHQWFGNLVTMEWWTHLWLNEGFASFMENTCTHALFPHFDIWTQFVGDTLLEALRLDALASSHPIEVEVGHPAEVDEIFDSISYNKGASVIRMLHHFIGNEAFRKSLHNYIKKFSYRNARTEDLWECLAEGSQKPVGQIMSTWTSQMGFPVIVVRRIVSQGDTTTLTLSQEKFNADGSQSEGYKWLVPIDILTSTGTTQSVLLEQLEMEVTLENTPEDAWVKLNPEYMGYYRVQYPENYMVKFSPDIASKKLSELNRLALLDDLMAFVQAGRVKTSLILEMIRNIKNEDSYVVWRSVGECFGKLSVLLADEACRPDFKKFVIDTMEDVVEKVGWGPKAEEHHTQGLLRSMVISRLGQYGHDNTVQESQRQFQAHVEKLGEILADLRAPVYRTVMAHGGEDTYQQMLALYRDTDLHEEKDRISRAMGASQDIEVLKKVLEFAISDEVRSQDSPFIIGSVASNVKGRELAWTFFKDHFDLFYGRYKGGSLMARLIKSTADAFKTDEKAEEVTKFFESKGNPAERSVKQSIESIRLNAAWWKRDGKDIQGFFNSM